MKILDKIKLKVNANNYYYKKIIETKKYYMNKMENPDGESKYEIKNEENYNVIMLYDEWDEYKSDKFIKLAHKYDLKIPKRKENNIITEYWRETIYGNIILSAEGMDSIKLLYREETKWKRESVTFLVSIIFGILGLATGLITIILTN